MPRWVGYGRLAEQGAKLTGMPKPPWWRLQQRAKWRADCVSTYLLSLFTEGKDALEGSE